MADTVQDTVERLERAAERYRNNGDFAGETRAEAAIQQASRAPTAEDAAAVETDFLQQCEDLGDPVPGPPPRTPPGTPSSVGGTPYVVYEDYVLADGSLSWRNNNPGNITSSDFADENGSIGSNEVGDLGFAIFPTYDAGRAAQIALLNTGKYQDSTIEQAVAFWAPKKTNPHYQEYVDFITNALGVEAVSLVSDLTGEQLIGFADAQQRFEGWTPGTQYEGPTAPLWVQDLLGTSEE